MNTARCKENNMHLKPIKSKKDYQIFLKWADGLFEKKVKSNTLMVKCYRLS